jgi:hypothetical protein
VARCPVPKRASSACSVTGVGDGAQARVKGVEKRAMRRQPALLKSGSVARGREEKGRGRHGRVRVEAGEGGEGGPGVAVGGSGQPTMAPDHQVRVVQLPHEQRRATGVGDAGNGVSATDGWDQGEAGPDGSGRGVRETRESETGAAVGRRHVGSGGTVSGAAVQTGFETMSEFKCFKEFKTILNFG